MATPIGISRSLARRGDGSIWTGSGIPPVAGSYDLYATDDQSRGVVPFAVNWPEAPNTTQTINVPADMSISSAALVDGAIINVAAGSYGALDLRGASDQRWNMDDNAVFTNISIGRDNNSLRGNRIHIDGGRIDNTSQLLSLVGDDLLFTNVNWRYLTMLVGSGLGRAPFQRVAFVQCSLFAYSGMMLLNNGAENGFTYNQDFIFAGNYFAGGMDPATSTPGGPVIEFGIRMMSTIRAVVVDNRGRNGLQGLAWKNTYRIQDGMQDVWMRRNMTEYGDAIRLNSSEAAVAGILGEIWVYDHRSYTPTNITGEGLFGFKQTFTEARYPEPLHTDGNVGYHYATTVATQGDHWMWVNQAAPWDVVGSNLDLPYEDPPLHSEWLTANGTEPGADHGPVVDSTFDG